MAEEVTALRGLWRSRRAPQTDPLGGAGDSHHRRRLAVHVNRWCKRNYRSAHSRLRVLPPWSFIPAIYSRLHGSTPRLRAGRIGLNHSISETFDLTTFTKKCLSTMQLAIRSIRIESVHWRTDRAPPSWFLLRPLPTVQASACASPKRERPNLQSRPTSVVNNCFVLWFMIQRTSCDRVTWYGWINIGSPEWIYGLLKRGFTHPFRSSSTSIQSRSNLDWMESGM